MIAIKLPKGSILYKDWLICNDGPKIRLYYSKNEFFSGQTEYYNNMQELLNNWSFVKC